MNASEIVLRVDAGTGPRDVRLYEYLQPSDIEAAEEEAIAWIKALRHAVVDGQVFRARFRHRDESLWWFAELYLHKRGVMASALLQMRALDALIARERPLVIDVVRGTAVTRLLASQASSRSGLMNSHRSERAWAPVARLRDEARGAFYAWSAFASHLGRSASRRPPPRNVRIAAFVHSAFWRDAAPSAARSGSTASARGEFERATASLAEAADEMPRRGKVDPAGPNAEGEETYIGPVLRAVADRLAPGELQLVGVGPRTNFRVRRWWHRVSEFSESGASALPFSSVDDHASMAALAASRQVWRDRHANRRSCWSSEALAAASLMRGYDLWPVVRQELAGVCELQFPWSARSMDEAGAALDALQPTLVLTYAEAGGWGRALMIEARRRRIPSVGLQHGFIYRHWLNYRHEPDEMATAERSRDAGFPRPTLTLLYDRFAQDHLERHGRFPPDALRVTGSPRLDELAAAVRRVTADDQVRVRERLGARPLAPLVLVASKFTQLAPAWQPLLDAVRSLGDVHFCVKCHPAESAARYERDTARLPNISVAPAGADLAELLATARVVVTVNSTVAVDAMVLGIPSLVLGLPNNLTPFVEAGAMAGAVGAADLATALAGLLYDEERRARLAEASRAFMARFAIGTDGHAAQRAADAILALADE